MTPMDDEEKASTIRKIRLDEYWKKHTR